MDKEEKQKAHLEWQARVREKIDQQVKKATTKSKKSKVKKDPGAPKRPASSYTLFCKQV